MFVMGLMSGTSVDGIDVALAEITGAPATADASATLALQPKFFTTLPWDEAVRDHIFALLRGSTTAAALCQANFILAEGFAQAALHALDQAGIAPTAVDLIGSHGQTIWHDVANGRVTSTLQLGDPAVIAASTGITTVGNFRTADIAVGGQGAPLVSTFDWHLLRPPAMLHGVADGWRAVQNIGGIANVTLLPAVGATAAQAQPLAFDTGPGNVLLDWAATQASGGQLRYDEDGKFAASGHVDQALLAEWLALPYFAQTPPKSTGRELFSSELAATWRAAAFARGLSEADFIATLTALTAASIADAYANFSPGPVTEVIVGGGGAHNQTLMTALAAALHQKLGQAIPVHSHTVLGIDADAKEALAFALLAYFALHGWASNVPACTGAREDAILGQIAPGKNYASLLRRTISR